MRNTFLLWTIPLLLVALIAGGAGVLSLVRSQLVSQLDQSLVERARSFASMVFLEEGRIELDYDGDLTEARLGVWIDLREHGEIVVQSPDSPWKRNVSEQASISHHTIVLDPHSRARSVSIDIIPGVDPDHETKELLEAASQRPLTLRVAGRFDDVDRAVSAVKFALIFSGFAAAVAMVLAVLWSVYRGLAPVRFLSHRIERLHPDGGPNQIDPRSSPAELAPMCDALRTMLTRTREAIERERRFADAAAHELRTPIAELRAASDVANRWPEPDRLHDAVIQAGEIAGEMEVLIECLLASTRANGGSLMDAAERLTLSGLVSSIATQPFEKARHRNIKCTVHGDPNATWTVARGAALTVLRNVVQNAVEYTPNGGSVTIEIEHCHTGASVTVQNAPVSISEHDVSMMFDPFWRSDESRTDTAHKGLGLSIVRSVCDLVGMTCTANLVSGSVLRIRLVQPED